MRRVKNAINTIGRGGVNWENMFLQLGASCEMKKGKVKKNSFKIRATCFHCGTEMWINKDFVGDKKKERHILRCYKKEIIFICPCHGEKYVKEERKQLKEGIKRLEKEYL
jgi:Rieske Fe-S protein